MTCRSLRQTVSWDMPMSATPKQQRTMSCDTSNEVTRGSSVSDDNGQLPAGISSSSSDHDNHEAGAWSSDYSNSEDEFTNIDDGVTPVSKIFLLPNGCLFKFTIIVWFIMINYIYSFIYLFWGARYVAFCPQTLPHNIGHTLSTLYIFTPKTQKRFSSITHKHTPASGLEYNCRTIPC